MLFSLIFGAASIALAVTAVIMGYGDVGFNRLFSSEGFESFRLCFGFGEFDQWIVTIGLIAVGALLLLGLLIKLVQKKGIRALFIILFALTTAASIYIYGAAPTPYAAVPGILNLVSIAFGGLTLLRLAF